MEFMLEITGSSSALPPMSPKSQEESWAVRLRIGKWGFVTAKCFPVALRKGHKIWNSMVASRKFKKKKKRKEEEEEQEEEKERAGGGWWQWQGRQQRARTGDMSVCTWLPWAVQPLPTPQLHDGALLQLPHYWLLPLWPVLPFYSKHRQVLACVIRGTSWDLWAFGLLGLGDVLLYLGFAWKPLHKLHHSLSFSGFSPHFWPPEVLGCGGAEVATTAELTHFHKLQPYCSSAYRAHTHSSDPTCCSLVVAEVAATLFYTACHPDPQPSHCSHCLQLSPAAGPVCPHCLLHNPVQLMNVMKMIS